MSTIAQAAQALTAVLPLLSAKDQDFASSLLNGKWGFYSTGKLSEKQLHWVKVLTERATTPAQARTKVDLGDFAAMIALFDRAGTSLKHPTITLRVEDGSDIVLAKAGDAAKFPGTINVQTPGGFGNNFWYGRILRDGKFEVSPRHTLPPKVLQLLQQFAANPVTVASQYGKLLGKCCFCNRELSDERSQEVGYGQRCASNYGLPWGTKRSKRICSAIAA